QLFTIAFSEPIEVFEWDASILPVDFVEMHTYHPLRVANEAYWYGHYCNKPWMVGETSLPADNNTIKYEWQTNFMRDSYRVALANGAAGYGWWEFGDSPNGVNFEAQYSGLFYKEDGVLKPKPALSMVKQLKAEKQNLPIPANYHNMLGYNNIALEGRITDAETGKGIEGAVIRGWNEYWSVGMNTFTDAEGNFTLYSNDICTHFEISAPGYSHLKFDDNSYKLHLEDSDETISFAEANLPEQLLEYQKIPLMKFISDTVNPTFFNYSESDFNKSTYKARLGEFKLSKLMK
ncbi:MAG: carboxypeptidase regulatory-like domain-containing protein, partial [Bacteroidales bacterium]|nr:carboxypeptidase regulatory-like domain-containing protein [Bacteroidales bacterium]